MNMLQNLRSERRVLGYKQMLAVLFIFLLVFILLKFKLELDEYESFQTPIAQLPSPPSFVITTSGSSITYNNITNNNPSLQKIGNDGRIEEFVVDTPTCKIPLTDLWPPFYKNNWNWSADFEKVPNCDQESHFIPFHILDQVINVTYPHLEQCKLKQIIRSPKHRSDRSFELVNQKNITSRLVNVSHMEMFFMKCNKSYNFEANIPMKPNVERKIKFWEKVDKLNKNLPKSEKSREVERPISILWLGIDTVSRRHVQRSLPKTLKILNEMGFLDFQGYHTINAFTIENAVPFFMGYSYSEMRDTCRQGDNYTYDSCPFIWKTFDAHNYITMNLEDWLGTFYSGIKGGFSKQPTDYYLHHLFTALQIYMDSKTLRRKDCMSSESVPQFMLRYTERFLQKFNSTAPFFAYVWFSAPFHFFPYSLPNLDTDFEKFFLNIKEDKIFLENTLIILNADHGDRFSPFRQQSVQGFLEESLIPLFIRIPERLLNKFPQLKLKEIALSNRNKLTTAYDIHHTLLHTLVLNGLNPYENVKTNNSSFTPSFPDRSSLFAVIPVNRTCDFVHIYKRSCTCNTSKYFKTLENEDEVSLMVEHAVNKLNSIINSKTAFKNICATFNASEIQVISADVVEAKAFVKHHKVVILKFRTKTNAKFEVKYSVTFANETRIEIDSLSRINSYANTSWCIEAETFPEKNMKEFCLCMHTLPERTKELQIG